MLDIYKSEKAKWIIGLVLILIIYTLFYLLFQENKDIALIPRKIRHLIKFITTISVYLLGTLHLGKIKDKWMASVWHFIHLSLLAVLISIGAYDWIFGMVSINIKHFSATIQEFLISPVLYVGMGIMNKCFNQS
jgi:hypothetical protein